MSLDNSQKLEKIDTLLTAPEAAEILSISMPSFWRRVADGTIPRPLKLGALSRWPRSEIAGVIGAAKAERHNAQGELDCPPKSRSSQS